MDEKVDLAGEILARRRFAALYLKNSLQTSESSGCLTFVRNFPTDVLPTSFFLNYFTDNQCLQ